MLFGNVVYSIKEQNGEITKTGILYLILMGLLRSLCWLFFYGIIYAIIFAVMLANDLNDSIISYLPQLLFLYPLLAFFRNLIYKNKLK